MIKRILVLLTSGAALCGGLYVLRAGRPRKSSQTEEAGLRFEPDLPAKPHEPPPPILTPHIVGLLVAAIVLGTAAYVGLGDRTDVAAVTPKNPSSDLNASLRDDVLSIGSHSRNTSVKTGGTPTPAPASPAAELQTRAWTVHSAVNSLIQTPTDGFEAIICSKPWPCAEAIEVASCESGLDRHGRLDGNWATNGHNYGLFQINSVHADRWPDFYQDWMDPVKNTEWAFEIWSKSGWAPWECQPEFIFGQKNPHYHRAIIASDQAPDTSTPVASPTPTPVASPTPTPAASPTPSPTEAPGVVLPSSTPSPPALSLPTRTAKP